jgi:hypothetical protein
MWESLASTRSQDRVLHGGAKALNVVVGLIVLPSIVPSFERWAAFSERAGGAAAPEPEVTSAVAGARK